MAAIVTNNRNDASSDQPVPPMVTIRKRKSVCPLRRRLASYEDFYPTGDCNTGMPPLFLINKRNHNPLFRIAMANYKAKETGKETGNNNSIQWQPAKIKQGRDRQKNVNVYLHDVATPPSDEESGVSLEVRNILNDVFDIVRNPKLELPTYNKIGKSLPAITMTLPRIQVPEKMKTMFPICTRKWYYNSPLYHNHPKVAPELSLRLRIRPEIMSVNLPRKPQLYARKIRV